MKCNKIIFTKIHVMMKMCISFSAFKITLNIVEYGVINAEV